MEGASGEDSICSSVQTALHFFSKDHGIATLSRWMSEKLSSLSLSDSQFQSLFFHTVLLDYGDLGQGGRKTKEVVVQIRSVLV